MPRPALSPDVNADGDPELLVSVRGRRIELRAGKDGVPDVIAGADGRVLMGAYPALAVGLEPWGFGAARPAVRSGADGPGDRLRDLSPRGARCRSART